MPRFAIGNFSSSSEDDDGEGPSSPRPKKHRVGLPARVLYRRNFRNNNNRQEDEELVEEDEELVESEYQEEDEQQEENDEEEEIVSEEENENEEEQVREDETCVQYQTSAERIVVLNGVRGGKRKDRDTVGPSGDGPISVTLTDPDVLDCPICLEPLTIPVFQCENGHTACSGCCSKLRNKCPSCSLPIGYNRCRAIEKVLESIKISCRNMKYGCKETVSYSQKHDHEQMCAHEPCSCPHPDCDFVGSSMRLYLHFNSKHPNYATPFCCDKFFPVPIKTDMKYVILQEHVDSLLFVLNYGVQSIGNVANITCIAPSSLQRRFSYELIASKGDSSVKLESFTESMPRWSEHLPQKAFLLVPSDFLGSSRVHSFQVCIRRHKEIRDTTPKT